MSSTETNRVALLAEGLYDCFIVRLAEEQLTAGRPAWFPLHAEPDAATYFEPATVRVMRAADFEFPGGGTAAALVDALSAFWMEQGETGLAAMIPLLHDLSAALTEEYDEDDGRVAILCYTMF